MPSFNQMGFNQSTIKENLVSAAARLNTYTLTEAKNTKPQLMRLSFLLSETTLQAQAKFSFAAKTKIITETTMELGVLLYRKQALLIGSTVIKGVGSVRRVIIPDSIVTSFNVMGFNRSVTKVPSRKMRAVLSSTTAISIKSASVQAFELSPLFSDSLSQTKAETVLTVKSYLTTISVLSFTLRKQLAVEASLLSYSNEEISSTRHRLVQTNQITTSALYGLNQLRKQLQAALSSSVVFEATTIRQRTVKVNSSTVAIVEAFIQVRASLKTKLISTGAINSEIIRKRFLQSHITANSIVEVTGLIQTSLQTTLIALTSSQITSTRQRLALLTNSTQSLLEGTVEKHTSIVAELTVSSTMFGLASRIKTLQTTAVASTILTATGQLRASLKATLSTGTFLQASLVKRVSVSSNLHVYSVEYSLNTRIKQIQSVLETTSSLTVENALKRFTAALLLASSATDAHLAKQAGDSLKATLKALSISSSQFSYYSGPLRASLNSTSALVAFGTYYFSGKAKLISRASVLQARATTRTVRPHEAVSTGFNVMSFNRMSSTGRFLRVHTTLLQDSSSSFSNKFAQPFELEKLVSESVLRSKVDYTLALKATLMSASSVSVEWLKQLNNSLSLLSTSLQISTIERTRAIKTEAISVSLSALTTQMRISLKAPLLSASMGLGIVTFRLDNSATLLGAAVFSAEAERVQSLSANLVADTFWQIKTTNWRALTSILASTAGAWARGTSTYSARTKLMTSASSEAGLTRLLYASMGKSLTTDTVLVGYLNTIRSIKAALYTASYVSIDNAVWSSLVSLLLTDSAIKAVVTKQMTRTRVSKMLSDSMVAATLTYSVGTLRSSLLSNALHEVYFTLLKKDWSKTSHPRGFNLMGFNRNPYPGKYVISRVGISFWSLIQASNILYVHQGKSNLTTDAVAGARLGYKLGTLGAELLTISSIVKAHSWVKHQFFADLRSVSLGYASLARVRYVSARLATGSYIENNNMEPKKVKHTSIEAKSISAATLRFAYRQRHLQGGLATESILFEAIATRKFDSKSVLLSDSLMKPVWIVRKKALYGNLIAGTFWYSKVQRTITDAINDLSREWKAQVEVYFDGPDNDPAIFETPIVASFELYEELKADNQRSILGSVSANELNLSLANLNRTLSPTNKQGPYYGKLLPNVMVKVRLFLKLSEDFWGDFMLGTFYTDDWNDSSNSTILTVRAYDRYYQISQKDFPGTRLLKDFTYYDLFELLFKTAGLSTQDYILDVALKQYRLKYSWIPQGTVAYALQFLAQAANSFVFVNRQNKFVVKSLETTLNAYASAYVTDRDQVVLMQIPTSYNTSYSRLEIDVVNPIFDSETEVELLAMDNVTIPSGRYTMANCKFSTVPSGGISKVITTGKTTRVEFYQASTDSVTIVFNNTGAQEELSILVYGYAVSLSTRQLITENQSIKDVIGVKTSQIKNNLIQDYAYAQKSADSIFPIMSNPHANVDTRIRGNPRILLGTIVDAVDDTDNIARQRLLVYRSQIKFSGGLSQSFQGYNTTK